MVPSPSQNHHTCLTKVSKEIRGLSFINLKLPPQPPSSTLLIWSIWTGGTSTQILSSDLKSSRWIYVFLWFQLSNKSLINNYNTYNLSRLAVAQTDMYFSKLSALCFITALNQILHCQFHAKRGAFNLSLLGVPQVPIFYPTRLSQDSQLNSIDCQSRKNFVL